MKKIWLNLVLGFISWLVPFAVSFAIFPLYDTDIFLFKTIMIVVGSMVGAILLIIYFLRIDGPYLSEGLAVGIVWFVINVIMDVIVLVPMAQMGLWQYFSQIGFRYTMIIFMALGFGFVLDRKTSARA